MYSVVQFLVHYMWRLRVLSRYSYNQKRCVLGDSKLAVSVNGCLSVCVTCPGCTQPSRPVIPETRSDPQPP